MISDVALPKFLFNFKLIRFYSREAQLTKSLFGFVHIRRHIVLMYHSRFQMTTRKSVVGVPFLINRSQNPLFQHFYYIYRTRSLNQYILLKFGKNPLPKLFSNIEYSIIYLFASLNRVHFYSNSFLPNISGTISPIYLLGM